MPLSFNAIAPPTRSECDPNCDAGNPLVIKHDFIATHLIALVI